MSTTLLLNASYEPIRVISWQRAVCLVLSEEAEVLEEDSEDPLRSQRLTMAKPLVVRLVRYVQVPFRSSVPLTKRALIARDGGVCVYCKKKPADSIDHVHPRGKGGRHEWKNVVAACTPCNGKKDDLTLQQLGWTLDFVPYAPKATHWLLIGLREPVAAWEPYLPVAKVA